jgi:hypothetical protein
MALSQIFPGSWKIFNARMFYGEGAFKSPSSTYQDIRDDLVYTYFGIGNNQTYTYLYTAECSITAGVNRKWVEVMNQ